MSQTPSPELRSLERRRAHERWKRTVSRFLNSVWVELSIALLILISVATTLVEFAFDDPKVWSENAYLYTWLVFLNNMLTWVFIIELTIRCWASSSRKRFFRDYWLDIIAVLPWFRIFRAARVVRLLRLMRLLRLLGIFSRFASHFPYIVKRGAVEYLVACGLLVVTVVFGAGAVRYFENAARPNGQESAVFDLEGSFWFSVYTLFAGEPVPDTPSTIGGKVVTVLVMFMGVTIFAMFTGTVSAFMIERFRMEGSAMEIETVSDHIVICGWNSKSEIIVREYRASPATRDKPIVVLAEFDHDKPALPNRYRDQVVFLDDDFTRVAALEDAGIARAATCIILADTSGGRSEQDADARTILAALTVEKMNSEVYTCAELLNQSYASHLKMGHVNDYVVSGEYSAYMLAQAAMNRGLMGVITELLTYEHGNEFYRLPINAEWEGATYLEALTSLKQLYDATLVAVHPEGGDMMVNASNHVFAKGDEIVVIAQDDFQLIAGRSPGNG